MDQIKAIKTVPTAIPSGIRSQDGSSDCLNHGSDRNLTADVALVKYFSSASMLRRFEAALGEELTLEYAQSQEQETAYIAYEHGDGERRGSNLVPPQSDFAIVGCGNANDDKTIGHPEDILIPIPSGISVISARFDDAFDIGVPWTLPAYPDAQGTYTGSNSPLPAASHSFYEPPIDVVAMSPHTTQPQPLFQSKHYVIGEIVREEDEECYDEDFSDVLGRFSDIGIVYFSSRNSSDDEETEEIERADHYHRSAPPASNNDSLIAHSGSVYLNDACTSPWPQLQSNVSFISNPQLPAVVSVPANHNHRLVESEYNCCEFYGVEGLFDEEKMDLFESASFTEPSTMAPQPQRLATLCVHDLQAQFCRPQVPLVGLESSEESSAIPRQAFSPYTPPAVYGPPTLTDNMHMDRAKHTRRNFANRAARSICG